jgi:hypothetical protein
MNTQNREVVEKLVNQFKALKWSLNRKGYRHFSLQVSVLPRYTSNKSEELFDMIEEGNWPIPLYVRTTSYYRRKRNMIICRFKVDYYKTGNIVLRRLDVFHYWRYRTYLRYKKMIPATWVNVPTARKVNMLMGLDRIAKRMKL